MNIMERVRFAITGSGAANSRELSGADFKNKPKNNGNGNGTPGQNTERADTVHQKATEATLFTMNKARALSSKLDLINEKGFQ